MTHKRGRERRSLELMEMKSQSGREEVSESQGKEEGQEREKRGSSSVIDK